MPLQLSHALPCAGVRSEYVRTIRSLWGFWTPICIFAFSVLPVRQQSIFFSYLLVILTCHTYSSYLLVTQVRQQSIFFSAISLAWNAILSFLSNETVAVQHPAEEQQDGAPTRAADGLLR